jgi:hypothetical protein
VKIDIAQEWPEGKFPSHLQDTQTG